ncbi:hypothetical protein Amet_0951 [Alkaliphilus metalliredigens QYMF]|uniref:DarT domain-containing protein n=1 Tax=Alkaliphilus metalliredigens (strain QYMF) TaxID=293826 RepID=A6TLV3_ALKMQ|nr:hypothetical protein [Alkaliphilus metalliredigens]ABR47171.1 hypothetical protein Amet_0951 [Alkaliphilus metalliredigens QYMF]
MFFEDYTITGVVYHIAPINDIKKILQEGIKFDDKSSYHSKYFEFHQMFDDMKSSDIPLWVQRKKAIFATLNYRKEPHFHSHTVLMALKVDPKKCWIANENSANQLYEPFILQDIVCFRGAHEYIQTKGRHLVDTYWQESISFTDNLDHRLDLINGYDAEVLIMHDVPPEDIQLLYIISDHRLLTIKQWQGIFCDSNQKKDMV